MEFIFLLQRKGNENQIYVSKLPTVLLLLLCYTQLCPTLCDPMDGSLPGSSGAWNSPGKNTGLGSHSLLQGIIPTQGSNPGLLHCRQILSHLSHQRSCKWLPFLTPGDLTDTGIELTSPPSPAL